MRPNTTPDEPGFPPNRGFAAFLGRGFWRGILGLIAFGVFMWLIFEWMTS